MGESKPRDEGDCFPYSRESSPSIDPPGGPVTQPSKSDTARSLTPRAPRFKHLSEAHRNITRQIPSGTTKGGTELSESPPPASPTTPGSTQKADVPSVDQPIVRLQAVKSQDDLQSFNSQAKVQSPLKKQRSASVHAIDYFRDLSTMATDRPSLREQIAEDMSRFKSQNQHISSNTIEQLLDQYDTSSSTTNPGFQLEKGGNQEPKDSSLQDSSLIDSQHLLDAEAQAQELDRARQELVPLPLSFHHANVVVDKAKGHYMKAQYAQNQHAGEASEELPYAEEQYAKERLSGGNQYHAINPFAHPDDNSYQSYLQDPMERDISRRLRRVSGLPGYSVGTFESLDIGPVNDSHQQDRPRVKDDTHPIADRDSKPMHQIKVVIGRDPKKNDNGRGGGRQENTNPHHTDLNNPVGSSDIPPDDADWVTEATSDVGFGLSVPTMPGTAMSGVYKQTGSSIADYSDEEQETTGRFGSRERIAEHPSLQNHYGSDKSQHAKAIKNSTLLARRNTKYPANDNCHLGNTSVVAAGQFRPHVLPKYSNPFRQPTSKRPDTFNRLAENIDKNAPSKYEFRDSVSEYEQAGVIAKANCDTNQHNTRGGLPLAVLGHPNESYRPSQYRPSIEYDPDIYSPTRISRYYEPYHTPRRGWNGEGSRSMYESETDRQERTDNLSMQQFAAVSSYKELPSISSVKSKFEFELLPLNLAQKRNKEQRDSGLTNETECGSARLKRQQSETPSDPRQPAKAFVTSRDLSIDFTPSSFEAPVADIEGRPIPFGLDFGFGHGTEVTPTGIVKFRQDSGISMPDTPTSSGRPPVQRRLWPAQASGAAPDSTRRMHRPRLAFVAPDDYVSDGAARIRKICFYILAFFSILPFVGVLVLSGAFSDALKWATQGEVDRLTTRQRRLIKWLLIVEGILYTAVVVSVVVYFGMKNKVQD
ncbi:hypothetical protein GGS20DRAFT_597253 [Poronia punctata]|nr:hypothetical protein GGS20DRAFT_597253 [Poronia punctata]